MLVKCSDAGVWFGAQQIFDHINLTIQPGERIALIGPNGAGKTTLLGLIAGEIIPDGGTVTRQEGLRIGYLRQNGGLLPGGTIQSEMAGALREVFATEQQLLDTAAEMARIADHQGGEYAALVQRYQALEARFSALDGHGAQVKISTVLTAMGFGSFDRQTPIETLSGGEQTRLMLCRLLLEEPSLLILDEATNHLDFKMLSWLEEYLAGYRGAVLAVSHDRYFLDRVTQATWEVENRSVICYPAPYSRYTALRAERLARMEKEYDRHLRQAARLRDYADRNMARASTSASAKSRLKMLDRLGEALPPPSPPRPPSIRFTPSIRPVSDILRVRDLTLSFGEGPQKKNLLQGFGLQIKRGERIAIVGRNGTGKSTLLKALLGQMESGGAEIAWGRNTRVSFFEQNAAALHPDKTALMTLWDSFPASGEQALRGLLGGLGLTGDQALKPVGLLSGGERARVKLALLMLERGNVLVLDEPTNHLDIPAKEALEEALLAFEGTLLVVSHDRWLLSRLPTRILRLKDGQAEDFDGGFEDMLTALTSRGQDNAADPPRRQDERDTRQQYHRSRAQRNAEAATRRRIAEIEREIEACEDRLCLLRGRMQSPQTGSDYQALCALGDEAAALAQQLEALYTEWDSLM